MMAFYHLSDDGCQRVLSRVHNDLVPKINIDTALTFLATFLKKDDEGDIKNLFTNEAKCRVLMRRIGKGGVNTYRKFKEYLSRDHNDLLKTLEKHEEELIIEHPDNEVVNSSTKLTDVHLARITLRVHHNFDPTAANLRIAEQTVEQIKKDYSYSDYEQVYQCLREWKEQNKYEATFGFLISQLQKCPELWSLKLSDFGRQAIEDDGGLNIGPFLKCEQPDPALKGSTFNCFNRKEEVINIKETDLHDGRLYELTNAMVEELKSPSVSDFKQDLKGAFGNIYISKEAVSGFNLRVVLKEIDLNQHKGHTAIVHGAVTNEKVAARLMHFGIVPLLAYLDDLSNAKHYFLSPYFENGDLFQAIQTDTAHVMKKDIQAVRMDWKTRVKIMYQIACAINYMHTGNLFRGKILHMDIKSKNIVMDTHWNARLIDFGLSRELKDGYETTLSPLMSGTKGYYASSKKNQLTEHCDYHSYGVVLLELVTGLEPLVPNGDELRNWSKEYIEERKVQTEVWTLAAVKTTIVDMAFICIQSVETQNNQDQTTLNRVIDTLTELCRGQSIDKWNYTAGDRCEICLVNAALKDNRRKSTCSRPIRTCCSCMRNSYINPVKCHSCGNTIEPFINAKWGAILVSGHDAAEKVQNMFKGDILKFEEVVTSKFLPAMCLNSDNVFVVTGKDVEIPIKATIEKAFNKLSQRQIETLLFVYSGHGNDKGIKVGKDELLPMDMLGEMFIKMKTENKLLGKVIVFQDCCFAKPLNIDASIKWIQLNATGPTGEAVQDEDTGYSFISYILQVFTARANGLRCDVGCDCISDLRGDFITLEDLRTCLRKHREQNNAKENGLCIPESQMYMHGIDEKNTILAYNYRFEVKISFTIVWPGTYKTMTKHVFPVDLKEFLPLKEILATEALKLISATLATNVDKNAVSKFANIMAIEIDTGPRKDSHVEELCTKERILLEWVSKRILRCTARDLRNIDVDKPVGHVLPFSGKIQEEYHKFKPERKPLSRKDLKVFIQHLQDPLEQTKDASLNHFLKLFEDFVFNAKQMADNCLDITFVDLSNEFTLLYMNLVHGSSKK